MRSIIPVSARVSSACISAWARKRNTRSSSGSPISSSRWVSPDNLATSRLSSSPTSSTTGELSPTGCHGMTCGVRLAICAACPCASRRAVETSTGIKRTLSPAFSWPTACRSASMTVTGQTNPPRLGPSGPRITGISPVKSTAPMAYGLSWMFDGCSPASPPLSRTHSGFGPIRRTPVRLELKCTSHSVAKKVAI